MPKHHSEEELQICFPRVLSDLDQLWASETLRRNLIQTIEFQAIVTTLLVTTMTGLEFCETLGERCNVTEDVDPWYADQDLHALINMARNAACHMTKRERMATFDPKLPPMKWTIYFGRESIEERKEKLGDAPANLHADDVMITIGIVRFYMNRNLARAGKWVKEVANRHGYLAQA